MSKVEIELNSAGVQELLKEVGGSVCVRMANEALGRCGNGYTAEVRNYPTRTAGIVKVNSHEGYHDNLENNTLIKAVWGG